MASALRMAGSVLAMGLWAALPSHGAFAQDAITFADSLVGWSTTTRLNLNGTQVSYRNWAKGGVNSISATGGVSFTALYQRERFSNGTRVTLRYGRAKVDGDGSRKTDDLINIRNRFLYDITRDGLPFKLFGNVQYQTQFDDGFEYGKTSSDPDILISTFLSPALLTENVGVAWVPLEVLSVEAGVGLKQTFVRKESLATRYGLGVGESFRNEGGVTVGIEFEKEVLKNVTYTSNLGTFTSLGSALKATDVNLSNLVVGKINSYLNTTFQFDVVYDRDYSTELQVSQVLGVGFSITL